MPSKDSSTRKHFHQAELLSNDKPTVRFIKLPKVKDSTSLSTSEIYRRIAAGTFPAQVTLGPKSVAWVEAEVTAWLDSLAAQRSGVWK